MAGALPTGNKWSYSPVDWSDVPLDDMGKRLDLCMQLSSTGSADSGCPDLCKMKFFLSDLMDRATIENVDITTLFQLIDQNHNIKAVVPELLYEMKHNKALKGLGLMPEVVKDRLGRAGELRCITTYRILLYCVSQGLGTSDLDNLKLLCSAVIDRNTLQHVFCGHHLFLELEKRDQLSKDKLTFLENILKGARLKSLAKKVAEFTPPTESVRGFSRGDLDSSLFGMPSNATSAEVAGGDSCTSLDELDEDAKKVPREDLEQMMEAMRVELENLKLRHQASFQESYKINMARPGKCLIVNIDEGHDGSRRKGSEIDCQNLYKVFTVKNFEIETKYNTSKDELKKLLTEYQQKDYSWDTLFVLCIMSHGNDGNIICRDGLPFKITDIMHMFDGNNCPGLCGKPKLFFIQACQGREMMKPADEEEHDLEMDADLPAMADMVRSMATFPGYVAFRSKTQGSWFITALCDVLREMSESMHLLDMLVEVNNRVAEAKAGKGEEFYKQCPAPMITLRKALWLRETGSFGGGLCAEAEG